ncbi:MAG: hydrogenase formation protein HypD [Candidatus Marinimicrobia bacterium]|nr:hydrogenase formation protein HypD [Candidatus Neomarinimicrobiota bacterium]
MKYIDKFRNPQLIRSIVDKIHQECPDRTIKLMEVCGGHTITIFKYGIQKLIPDNIKLISGPGCPVCVTDNGFIDKAVKIAHLDNVIITTFGDMIRVPGSRSSLQKEKGHGIDVRICYSPMDAITIAQENPNKELVFLGIGFETTAPAVAAVIKYAADNGINNFSVLSAHKTMPQAMKALLDSGDIDLNGFICPGHVSAITGVHIYDFITRDYQIPCVISGFEPLDMLQSILMIVRQLNTGNAIVENQYTRSVRENGNTYAMTLMMEVFKPVDTEWRGIGTIPGSGLGIRQKYQSFDANHKFNIEIEPVREYTGCICGDIMRGEKVPTDCGLFRKICHPEDPKGSCMVSDEGTCATYFKYVNRESVFGDRNVRLKCSQ